MVDFPISLTLQSRKLSHIMHFLLLLGQSPSISVSPYNIILNPKPSPGPCK